MKKNPERVECNPLMDMKMRDVMAIVQGYMNQTCIENMRKKNSHLDELEIDVDLNNTF